MKVNKVIANVSFQSSRHSQVEEDEWLTADKMAVSFIILLNSGLILMSPSVVISLYWSFHQIKKKLLKVCNMDPIFFIWYYSDSFSGVDTEQ